MVSANYNYVVRMILSFIIDYPNYLVWIIYNYMVSCINIYHEPLIPYTMMDVSIRNDSKGIGLQLITR